MLIPSHRHTADDLRLWVEYERADMAHGQSKRLAKKAAEALQAIGKFAAKGPCYAGVSWGKDSVVLADLVQRASRVYGCIVPLVWVRVEPICNPDCLTVRDVFLSANPQAVYHEIDSHCAFDGEWHASGTLEAGFRRAVEIVGAKRYISGVRADESSTRTLLARKSGVATATTCRPLTWWSAQDVFGWLAAKELPTHPVYAMTQGGLWTRDRLRVASLGGRRGDGMGRDEWERSYYGDILNRLQRLHPPRTIEP